MTETPVPVPEAHPLAVEAYFRAAGLPHLAGRGTMEGLRRRVRRGLAAAAVLLSATLTVLDLPFWESLVLAAVFLALALLLEWLLISQGALALFVHQGRPALAGLRATTSVAVRALPPLLAVLLFLALGQETWRAFGRLEGWRYGAVLIGFGLLSSVILLAGLRRERARLAEPEPGPRLADAARQTPAAPLVEAEVTPLIRPLERLERINLTVALFVSLAIRVLVVGLVVAGAFIVFGMLIVDRALTAEWIEQSPHGLWTVPLTDGRVVLTEALVRVATTLGGFASLYFVSVALGESRNREEFLDDELDRLGRVMAAWAYYRGALAPSPGVAASEE